MEICKEYSFNNKNYLNNFIDYMFISTPEQAEKHELLSGLIYDCKSVKNFIAPPKVDVNDILDTREKIATSVKKSVSRRNLCKWHSLIIYIDKEDTYNDITKMMFKCSYIKKESNKIKKCYAATHLYQNSNKPHIHILYLYSKDIKNYFEKLIKSTNY